MRKINLAFLIVAVCVFQACRNPESRAVDTTDSSVKDVKGQNTVNTEQGSGSNNTDNSSETAPGDITHKSSADDDSAMFIKEAGTGGLMEVALGKLAMQKASNAKVKAFAKQMVTDHGKANGELGAIARKAGIIIPTDFPPEKKTQMDMLKKLSGAEFDKQYMDMMVNDHQKTVQLFKTGMDLNKDDLVSFVKKTLPVIEGHYIMAKDIKAKM
jgi:putative membrane protein